MEGFGPRLFVRPLCRTKAALLRCSHGVGACPPLCDVTCDVVGRRPWWQPPAFWERDVCAHGDPNVER